VKIPGSVLIMGRTWPISHAKTRPGWVESKECVGYCENSGGQRRIWIKKTGDAEEDLATFAHEILHAMQASYQGVSFSDALDEMICCTLEGPLSSLLRDNDLSQTRRRK